jgi:hypothetical protein
MTGRTFELPAPALPSCRVDVYTAGVDSLLVTGEAQ